MAAVEGVLERIRPQIAEADFDLVSRLVTTVSFVMAVVRGQRAIISRLRRIFGLSSSEKTDSVLGNQRGPEGEASRGGTPPAGADSGTSPSAPEPSVPGEGAASAPAKGHGRVPADAYANATRFPVAHDSLTHGCRCPDCRGGNLYDLEPASIVRIVGQPTLAALRWDIERLRCGTCGKVFTAKAPQEAQGPKFDETAVSMLALCHYDAGLPLNRIERLQQNLQTPIPASTQWDVLDERAPTFKPVFDEMARQAAQQGTGRPR